MNWYRVKVIRLKEEIKVTRLGQMLFDDGWNDAGNIARDISRNNPRNNPRYYNGNGGYGLGVPDGFGNGSAEGGGYNQKYYG